MSVLDKHSHFYRPVDCVEITKVRKVEPENGVRAYCTMSGCAWAVQVRGMLRLANGQDSKDFVVATASLGLDDLAEYDAEMVRRMEDSQKLEAEELLKQEEPS